MKKRIWTMLLTLVMAASVLVIPAGAAETVKFSDVADQNTAIAVESLRLMGVLDGYGDGTFRPNNQLTRAQFCKIASYAMDCTNELGMYRTVTVFPDVKPSHWASAYINMAAKGERIIAGYPDGKFYPERTVTVGQAVTILLRLLGYKDEDVGGVWPDSYMAAGAIAGLTEGIDAGGNAPLTRAQAARLFLNLLQAEKKEGGTLYELGDETELLSIDGGTGIMKTSDGKSYTMAQPVAASSLVGSRGRVVVSKGKALTFLPLSGGSTGNAAAAVIVYADKSSAGFSALAGNDHYQIYKNGTLATVGDLRKNDVATYYAATNSILVCDTRVSVYYESCEPTPSAATKIQVLGGTELYVLPTAMDSLAAFKPGQQMTLLLTADGQVAGAVESSGTSARSNAVGVVSSDGTVQMLCGTGTIQLALTAEEKYYGQVVRLSSGSKDKVNMTVLTGNVRGDLNVSDRTLGSKKLADSAMVFDNGELISLSKLTTGVVKESQIKYARTNWAGEVDLVVLNRATDEIYGRVFWEVDRIPVYDDEGNEVDTEYDERLGVEYGNGANERTKTFGMKYNVRTGDYVAVKINSGGTGFSSLVKLTKLADVSQNAWIGKSAVTFGGKTYEVPKNVQCYNLDSKEWTTLEKALAYAEQANLYAKDGVIRVVEVQH